MSTLRQLSQVPMVPYELNQILYHNISNLTILKNRLANLEKLPNQDVKSGKILDVGS